MIEAQVGEVRAEQAETREILDQEFSKVALFLQSLLEKNSHWNINDQNIVSSSPEDEEAIVSKDSENFFHRAFRGLQLDFQVAHETIITELQQDPLVISATNIEGCVVVVYDSSVGQPSRLENSASRGDYTSSSYFRITTDAGETEWVHFLGMITVDLNPELRKDGVTPTTTLRHELVHYLISMSDYLISKSEAIGMHSAFRKGRAVTLYGSENRMSTLAALEADMSKYSELMGRPETDILPFDLNSQQLYLDELCASVLQRKVNWLSAEGTVYNNLQAKGRHWEVVGSNLEDQEATKQLLAVIQMVVLCEIAQKQFSKQDKIESHQAHFIEAVSNLMVKIISLIGVSRGIIQAVRLTEKEWKYFAHDVDVQKVLSEDPFYSWCLKQFAISWSSPCLRKLFEESVISEK